jgi:hypothetical protein
MLQVLETLHLMCIFIYFFHIALQILNCSYKKFKKGKIPYSFLPSLLIHNFIFMISTYYDQVWNKKDVFFYS